MVFAVALCGMLRITCLEDAVAGVTLQLEGQVVGPWVEELRRSCELLLLAGERVTLDLRAVSFLDLDGVALLRSMMRRQVLLRCCSAFVGEQLNAVGGGSVGGR